MAETVRDALLLALDDLVENSFKRFRNKLMDCNIKTGKKKISKSKLEKADREDTVGLILDCYEEYGAELTVDVLEAIDENRVASDLKKNLEKVKERKTKKPKEEPPSTSEGSGRSNIGGVLLAGSPGENRGERKPMQPPQIDSSASCSGAPKKHFVDEHREALISGVPLVEPILDSLMSAKLLEDEDYETILKEGTSYAQMRKLYSKYVKSWKDPQKDVFKNALRKKNRILVENLEKS